MRKKIFYTIRRMLLVALLAATLVVGVTALRQMFIWEQYDTMKIVSKIYAVSTYESGATLDVLVGGKPVRIEVQDDTIIRNKNGRRLDYEDLVAGQEIEAIVEASVRYETWTDVETGIRYAADVYYKCYKIVVK